MELIGQTLAGKYRLDELIQTGGIGQLYRATHILMDKRVTLKVLNSALAQDTQIAERFASEAKISSRLSHPNILNVTDYGTDENGTVFLVMENLEGESLTQVIRREGIIALSRAVGIVRQTASALTVAHNAGVSHLNLQPENILMTQTAEKTDWIKVFNFSVAPNGNAQSLTDNALTGEVSGNPRYLSPEQCFDGELDHRADIYSLGIIFYEMLTGKVPFEGETAQEIMLKQVEMPPPSLSETRPDLPNEIEYVLSRALAKKPIQRFQSAVDFAEALTRAANAGEEETLVRPREMSAAAGFGANSLAPTTGETTAENGNNLWKTAFIVTLGIAVLSAVMFYLTWGRKTDVATIPNSEANSNPVQPINPATGMGEQNLTYNPNANMGNTQVVTGDPYGGMPNVPGGIPPGVPFGQVPKDQNYNYPPAGSYTQPGGYPPASSVPTGIPPGLSTGAPIVTTNCGSEFMPCDTTIQTVPNPAFKPTPNASNVNANVNTNSNKAKTTNTNTKATTNANVGGKTTTNPPKNANVAAPPQTNPEAGVNPPAPNPDAKPPTNKVPKPAQKPGAKQPEKPKTEKPQTAPESTGKQVESQ